MQFIFNIYYNKLTSHDIKYYAKIYLSTTFNCSYVSKHLSTLNYSNFTFTPFILQHHTSFPLEFDIYFPAMEVKEDGDVNCYRFPNLLK